MEELDSGDRPRGRFAANVMHFARALRASGLPVGPGHVLEALRAIETVGISSRTDLYWTLHAVFVTRRDQRDLFNQCFHVFWRDPKILDRLMNMMMPQMEGAEPEESEGDPVNRRVAEAFTPEKQPGKGDADGDGGDEAPEPEFELDAVMTYSAKEIVQEKDFEQMSGEELELARRQIKRLKLPIMDVPTRRFAVHPHGRRIDMRTTLRRSLRGGGAVIDLTRKRRRRRHPPLVILSDISGSMSRYSRMLLLFMHAVTSDRDRVHSFLFGTNLTNVTRYLRYRDIDRALEKIGHLVNDWSGGTRIGHCLEQFNREWSRRVLGQGALVLFITDGLDRDGAEGLEVEMERLHKSCRRLIWLNPLLRYEGYEPISTGARAMIRHVDDFRTIHNLASFEDLTAVLSHQGRRTVDGMSAWIASSEMGAAA